jgi:hypothetical protein
VTAGGAPAGKGAGVDVLVVSLGSTGGWLAADRQLVHALQRAGASVAVCTAQPAKQVRTLMLTDLAWARAARAAAGAALERHAPHAVIYCTSTAALLWPRPGAIRFDALAAANRPGRHGLWQRPIERRRLGSAPLLLPWSEGALTEANGAVASAPLLSGGRTLVVPVAVAPSGPIDERRDIAAVTYAANPTKKGTARVLEAWQEVARPGEQLIVAGADHEELTRAGIAVPAHSEAVRVLGRLAPDEYRAWLRRARVFVCAPRREDYGIAQLEALADGCLLVTTAAPGPYVALPIARDLDARLVGDDLGGALRSALDSPLPDYTARAQRSLVDFSVDGVQRVVASELLPRLLGGPPRGA